MLRDTYRLRVIYEKKGIAKFISGKNFAKIVERCVRRSQFPVRFTEGFSPHPRISFGPPLPVNIEGESEILDIYFTEKIDSEEFIEKINNFLPEGIIFKRAFWVSLKEISLNSRDIIAIYRIAKDGLKKEILEQLGKVEEKGDFFELVINIKNFSHKKLLEKVGKRKIIRKILWQEK